MKKVIKSNNLGITLIALVVTIIVLIILAGIAVATLMGDNGILKNASTAKKLTAHAQLEEEVDMAYLGFVAQTNGTNDLEYYLNEINGATIEKLSEDTWYVSRDEYGVTIRADGEKNEGKVEVWDGISKECPEFKNENNIWHWYIYNPAQLKFLADFVNNGNSLTGTVDLTELVTNAGYNTSDVTIVKQQTYVYLMKDLDMGARKGIGKTEEEKWEVVANESKNWTPIGREKASFEEGAKNFLGIFEGNNHYVSNLYCKSTGTCGIFGGSPITVRNVTIKNSYIKSVDAAAGGIASIIMTSSYNCHNINTYVSGMNNVGGLFGSATGSTKVIRDCSSSGNVEGNSYVGGIAGQISTLNATIENCTNSGNIKGTNQLIGGVVGNNYRSCTITNCTNDGNVEGNKVIGGILGYQTENSIILNCINNGNVSVDGNYAGGIAGRADGNIDNSTNTGTVTGKGERIGGVVGGGNTGSNIHNCTNTGNVTGGVAVGGIAGVIFDTAEKCVNTGTVIAEGDYIGGIVGYIGKNNCKILNCYNTGTLIEDANNSKAIGGIVGWVSETGTSGEISHNYSNGTIQINGTSVTEVGGAIGHCTTAIAANFEINNNYYEQGKSNVILNNNNNLEEGKTTSDMKTQGFVDLLNGGQEVAVWELGTGNNGYPTLKKEE